MKEKNTINLVTLKKDQRAIIVSVTAGHKATKRLADLGLTPNTQIKVLRKAGAHGPIEIKVRGANLILGKGIISKILVERIWANKN
jgi:Fe2+ transport system protein FeoA